MHLENQLFFFFFFFWLIVFFTLGFPCGSMVKNSPAIAGDTGSIPGEEDPWRRKWQPTPVFLPGKFHGNRSPTGYSPWGHKTVRHGLATTRVFHIIFLWLYIFRQFYFIFLWLVSLDNSILGKSVSLNDWVHSNKSKCGPKAM